MKQEIQVQQRKLQALDPLLYFPDDMLNLKSSFVEYFYRLITESINPPFSISIDGLWGTGKTTIMQMLEVKLYERGYPVFWFNPWEYRKTGDVVLAFLQYLAVENRTFLEKTKEKGWKIFKVLSVLGMQAVVKFSTGQLLSLSEIKDAFQDVENHQPSYETYTDLIASIKREFIELINAISEAHDHKPVIIFFDDLDRCLPDDAIQLLEALKNLFTVSISKPNQEKILCKSIIICGIDTRVAKQFIKAHYKDIEDSFAIDYFRKIFNLTISIPYHRNIYDLLIKHIQQLYNWNDPDGKKAKSLANMISTRGLRSEIASVRKYLNIVNNFYTFLEFNPSYEYNYDNDFVVHCLILKEAWQPLYEIIVREALKTAKEELSNLLENLIEPLKKKGALLPGQEKFLRDYFFNKNYPFYNIDFGEFLFNYPTLA